MEVLISKGFHLFGFGLTQTDSTFIRIVRKFMKSKKRREKKPVYPLNSFCLIPAIDGVYEKVIKRISYSRYVHLRAKKCCHMIFKTLSYISEDLPTVIHSHGMYSLNAGLVGYYLSRKTGYPHIITLHGSDVNFRMQEMKELYIEVLENATKVIFVSNALKNKAIEYGYSGKNAVVIPNGYDPEIFYLMDKEEMRKHLGIYKEGYKYVGFVGNLIYVKRADKLPEIFKMIKDKVEKVIFIIVGDGDLKSDIENRMKKYGLEYIFTGRLQQKEVSKWMGAMDVMVLPSREEGFGMVVVEAQACGTVVVGSSNGGIPEAIGFEEFVVEEGKDFEKRFAEKVSEILIRECDVGKIMERVKNFTWENIVKREVEIYRKVVMSY